MSKKNEKVINEEMVSNESIVTESVETEELKKEASTFDVKVDISVLNIRKGPGYKFDTIGEFTGTGVFTIVEEKDGWGRLSSGKGWIALEFTTRV